MTTWGSGRTYGPFSRGEKPVGNDFLTSTEDMGTSTDYDGASGGVASADGGSGSPLAIGTSIVTLNIPDDAVELVLCGSSAFLYSEDVLMTHWFRVPADTVVPIGVAQRNTVYVKTSTGTSNLSIKWVLI